MPGYSKNIKWPTHRIIAIQIEHQMSSFQDLRVYCSQYNPAAEAQWSSAQAALNYKTDRRYPRNSVGPLPQGY